MPTKTAAELMIPIEKYPHITHWTTIREAVEVIEEAVLDVEGRRSLPRVLLVFDEEHNLLGLVRRRDILKGLEPKFLKIMPIPHRKQLFNVDIDPNLVDLSSGKIGLGMRQEAEQSVSEIMQPILATCNYDDHLAKVIYKMVNRNQSLIPVMKDGKVIGVIRSVDVFQEVAKLLLIADKN
jgi:predicted transcriptional regulator